MNKLDKYDARERFFLVGAEAGMPDFMTEKGSTVRLATTCQTCSALVKGPNGMRVVIEPGEPIPTQVPGTYLLTAVHLGLEDFTISLIAENAPASFPSHAASDTGRDFTSLAYLVTDEHGGSVLHASRAG